MEASWTEKPLTSAWKVTMVLAVGTWIWDRWLRWRSVHVDYSFHDENDESVLAGQLCFMTAPFRSLNHERIRREIMTHVSDELAEMAKDAEDPIDTDKLVLHISNINVL